MPARARSLRRGRYCRPQDDRDLHPIWVSADLAGNAFEDDGIDAA
jgi:hypothetical protein